MHDINKDEILNKSTLSQGSNIGDNSESEGEESDADDSKLQEIFVAKQCKNSSQHDYRSDLVKKFNKLDKQNHKLM